jgi:hypothetical protein
MRIRLIVAVTACIAMSPAHGLRSTDFESFTDPDFIGYRPMKVVIVVASGDIELVRGIESRLTDALADRGVEAVSGMDLFPPTRPIESYDLFGTIAQQGIDSAIIVTPGDSSSQVQAFGSSSYSTVNAYGNQATVSTTTTPMILASSKAAFTVVLSALGKDRDSTRVAWYAQVSTKASGTLFVGAKGDAKGAVKAIIQGLTEDGHLPSAR